jgi:hypothetical protein
MARKKIGDVSEVRPVFVFPGLSEIERQIQRRIQFWENPKRRGPYPLPVLDFLINVIGCELQTSEDNEEFGKDAEFYNPTWYTNGITNGELFYSLYTTVRRMAEDEKFNFVELPLCDREAFASMLYLGTCLFLDRLDEPELADERVDLWVLCAWTRKMRGYDLWQTENGEVSAPPGLRDLKDDDWKSIAEEVAEHFSEDGENEYLEIALLDQQPHWPTFQEFRSAKAHLLNWYGRTRANTQQRAD